MQAVMPSSSGTPPSASASTLAHDPGRTRCACEQQSMNAVPWILAAAFVLLGLNWLAGRRKKARRQRSS